MVRSMCLTRQSSGPAPKAAQPAHFYVRTSEEKKAGGWFSAVPEYTSLQAQSKDPFASRNVFLLSLVSIREVSDGVVRQAVLW